MCLPPSMVIFIPFNANLQNFSSNPTVDDEAENCAAVTEQSTNNENRQVYRGVIEDKNIDARGNRRHRYVQELFVTLTNIAI